MRATYLVVLMILAVAANSIAILLGAGEMLKLTRLTNGFTFVVLVVYYITMGLYYMVTKRYPNQTG
jgi:hypothetical protein